MLEKTDSYAQLVNNDAAPIHNRSVGRDGRQNKYIFQALLMHTIFRGHSQRH